MANITQYPENLTKSRELIEGNFIFTLYKNPDLYDDYKKDISADKDLLTMDGKFYYSLGLELHKKGFNSFDHTSIYTFLADKEVLRKGFEQRGGYKTIQEMTSILSQSNVDSYYDELVKSNAVIQLYTEGYDIDKYIDKFNQMTYSQLEDYMEYKLNNIFLKSNSGGMHVADLTTDYNQWIDKWDKGEGIGFKVGFPMLNYHLAGIHKKNLILHLGGIGSGKTSTAIPMYILPIIESGEEICILANEQDEDAFRIMILSTVLFNRINYRKMNRQKFLFGGFTDDDKVHLRKASEWLEQYKDKLHYVHLTDYGTANVKRIIKKYSKLGCSAFILDTLKPIDESSDKAWAEFSETSKMLFQLSQKEDIAIIATAQLSSESAKRKYLDLSCIGKSRAIAETAGQVIMFRPVRDSEKSKLNVYTFTKDAVTGKNTNIRKQIPLDEMKDYIVVFIAKNRYGSADTQIVYERNFQFNYLKELGYCHIEYDGFGK